MQNNSILRSASTEVVPVELEGKPQINVTINIKRADERNWSLLQRVQSAISKSSKLDIQGPREYICDFVTSLNHVAADHAHQTAAAVHWEKAALKSLAEIDLLQAKLVAQPACSVFAHQNLTDELEAKNMQLQIQALDLASMEKKIARARAFFDEANAEMHQQKATKLTDIAATEAKFQGFRIES
jgi:hypothetical protein